MLKTFWNYYGGKWRIANRYPAPKHKLIIEPFAGAAGYSLCHHKHDVLLVDADPVIYSIWQWLIEEATPEDVMRLPVIGEFSTVDAIDAPLGARNLIGFCVNAGAASPCKTPSKWAREIPKSGQFWSAKRRQRVANQVPHIKHWRCINGSYADVQNVEATWFVDPPYQGKQGAFYRKPSTDIDYDHLAAWCKERQGQTIVCESGTASWLPFAYMMDAVATPKHGARTSKEYVWVQG